MKRLLLIALLGSAFPALADRLPMPANTPVSFTSECSSCHIAYQPALLQANDWRKLMAGPERAFWQRCHGRPEKTEQEITAFLERNAGNASRLGNAGNLPRITQTARFIRKHDEIPAKYWRDPRVKSKANCEACHPGAAKGSYSEHDISIRELRE